MRRIGVLMPLAVGDPEAKARLAAFLDAPGLAKLGEQEMATHPCIQRAFLAWLDEA
jgi:hypothetical protein